MEDGAVLEMRGICKFFPGVRALENVDFTLREGEIHALMGENGAGKSTLIKVLTGVYPKDAGTVRINGIVTIYSLDILLSRFGISLLFHVQFELLLPNLHTDFSIPPGRSSRNQGRLCRHGL